MNGLFLVSVWIIGIIVYFIPSTMSYGKASFNKILALNILLGWTILGWIGALIWAVMSKEEVDIDDL